MDNTIFHFTAGNGMSSYMTAFMNAAGDWSTALNTVGSSISFDQGSGDWTVELDDTLPTTVAGETHYDTKTIKINASKTANLEMIALHELGHVLLLQDVYGSECSGMTAMGGQLEIQADFVTSADSCTLDHVYHLRDESPIILTLEPGYPELTGPEVSFDLSNSGVPQLLGWTKQGAREGFLVLDRDGDGRITSGLEMFGNYTPFPCGFAEYVAADGFQALAAYDDRVNGGNGDGWITASDHVFSSLRVWIDENHNGVSELDELHTLTDLGIEAISLAARESPKRDRHGNKMRYVAPFFVRTVSGELVRRLAVDVYFVHQ